VGPEIVTFLGPEMGTSVASAIWAQKSRDFRAHPFKRPEKWISLQSSWSQIKKCVSAKKIVVGSWRSSFCFSSMLFDFSTFFILFLR
jgi:hypothetical protein